MAHKLFVNLPVSDLDRAKAFFARLGFSFNARFTDAKAACMVIGEDAYAMLLVEPFFRTFTDRERCGATTHTEAILAVSCDSRAAVDQMADTAIAAGGRQVKPATDHGFMYGRSFYDLDGHHWEVLWMDPQAVTG